MAEVYRETHTIRQHNDTDTLPEESTSTVARVVYLISGVIVTFLAFRFVLMLLGANRVNGFTNLIYGITQPLITPFVGMFNLKTQYGVSKFELETLIAMVVYAFLAWVIVRLVTLNRTDEEV